MTGARVASRGPAIWPARILPGINYNALRYRVKAGSSHDGFPRTDACCRSFWDPGSMAARTFGADVCVRGALWTVRGEVAAGADCRLAG